MKYLVQNIALAPDETPLSLRKRVAEKLGVSSKSLRTTVVRRELKRTKDGGYCEANVEAETNEFIRNTAYFMPAETDFVAPDIKKGERPVVVGFGLSGMIAAYALVKLGLRPIVLEQKPDIAKTTTPGSVMATGMLLWLDRLEPELKSLLAKEGILFTNPDACQVLPPAFMKSFMLKLYSRIVENGGEVIFDAQYVGYKNRFGKLRYVYFTKGDKKLRLRATQLLLANGERDDEFYVGSLIATSMKPFNEFIYGKPIVDSRTAPFFVKANFRNKNGVSTLFFANLPKPTLVDVGGLKQRTRQCFEFSGKGKNAASFIACEIEKEQWNRLSKEAYLGIQGRKSPFSTLGDFRQRRDPLKLGIVKPADSSHCQIASMHRLFGREFGDSILSALAQASRAFPFLREDEGLIGGMVLLHGCRDYKNEESKEKTIHVIAVSAQDSLDFASVCSASLRVVRALYPPTRKAH